MTLNPVLTQIDLYHLPKATAGAGASSRLGAAPSSMKVDIADKQGQPTLSHLDRLEAESIHIMREVEAQAENPVMLYSVGKDSSVMLHCPQGVFPQPASFSFDARRHKMEVSSHV